MPLAAGAIEKIAGDEVSIATNGPWLKPVNMTIVAG